MIAASGLSLAEMMVLGRILRTRLALLFVSAITRTSAEGLNLQAGDSVVAIIKSTEVMIGKNV